MNKTQQNEWKNRLLDEVLIAFAAHAGLRDVLIFKGARILNRLLGDAGRQSLDLDSNLTIEFTHGLEDLDGQKEYLEKNIVAALRTYFESSDIVRHRPVTDSGFWSKAASEFRLACQSRSVDCKGLDTFAQGMKLTRELYLQDATVPADISFDECWESLSHIMSFFGDLDILPIETGVPQATN